MANHINDFFKACTPKQEQKTKILNKILDEIIRRERGFICNKREELLTKLENNISRESKIKIDK